MDRRARMTGQQQDAQIRQETKQQDVMVVEEEEINDVEEEEKFLHSQSDKRILHQQATVEQRYVVDIIIMPSRSCNNLQSDTHSISNLFTQSSKTLLL